MAHLIFMCAVALGLGACRAPAAPPASLTAAALPAAAPSRRGETAASPSGASPPLMTAGSGYLGVIVGDLVDVAAPIDARVEALLVRVGDRVTRDAPLARLNRAALDEDLAMATAAVSAARAARDKARLELGLAGERATRRAAAVEISHRTVGLASDEERSTAQYEERLAGARLGAAKAELAERGARLEQLRALAREAELRAPCDGVVAAELVDAGAQARRGAPILRLLAGGAARIRFALPEAEVGTVAVGDRLRIEAGGRTTSARVARLAPEINRSARMLFVEATIDGGDDRLRVGEVARVRPETRP